jgi:hypothetical protein
MSGDGAGWTAPKARLKHDLPFSSGEGQTGGVPDLEDTPM